MYSARVVSFYGIGTCLRNDSGTKVFRIVYTFPIALTYFGATSMGNTQLFKISVLSSSISGIGDTTFSVDYSRFTAYSVTFYTGSNISSLTEGKSAFASIQFTIQHK